MDSSTKAEVCQDQVWNIKECAEFLRVDVKTVRKFIRDGKIPAMLSGNVMGYRILKSNVIAALSQRQGGAA